MLQLNIKSIFLIVAFFTITIYLFLEKSLYFKTEDEIIKSFYSSNVPEIMISDPLILSGKRILPFILKEIENKNMERRRYAISFLGDGVYSEALPSLINIFNDNSEKDYFRKDALIAIYKINNDLAEELLSKSFLKKEEVQEYKKILNNKIYFEKRSYIKALISYF